MKKRMQFQLKMEELAMLLLSFGIYGYFSDQPWWAYAALFLVPDVSFAAYAVNAKMGALAYNILHHKGLALLLFAMGWILQQEWMLIIGMVFFGHASFDRIFGYGLKYPDSFQHTHLGYIGKGDLKEKPLRQ